MGQIASCYSTPAGPATPRPRGYKRRNPSGQGAVRGCGRARMRAPLRVGWFERRELPLFARRHDDFDSPILRAAVEGLVVADRAVLAEACGGELLLGYTL